MDPARYEAILFDFDGVLIDSEPVHLDCWMAVLSPLGIRLDWDAYVAKYIGVDDRLMLAALCDEAVPRIAFEEAWARYPQKKRLFEQRMHRPGAVDQQVCELLGALQSKIKIAVVTSSARSEVEPILESSGLLPLLGTVVYGDDVKHHKPSPEPYLLAAERLGVSRALVVEDSPAGCESGRAAGFDVLRIPAQREVVALVSRALALDQNNNEPQDIRS